MGSCPGTGSHPLFAAASRFAMARTLGEVVEEGVELFGLGVLHGEAQGPMVLP